MSLECDKLVKKLMTLDSSERETSEEIIRHLWLKQGPGGGSYSELLCDNRDPQVTEVMMTMDFEWDKIQDIINR